MNINHNLEPRKVKGGQIKKVWLGDRWAWHSIANGVTLPFTSRTAKEATEKLNFRYTVEPGRNIYRNGIPFIYIQKAGETSPTEADMITHVIAELLNANGR
jgi:hypothetical protein